jgi:hypothetical protein
MYQAERCYMSDDGGLQSYRLQNDILHFNRCFILKCLLKIEHLLYIKQTHALLTHFHIHILKPQKLLKNVS